MAGILCLAPLLSGALESTLAPLWRALGLDPAMLGGVLMGIIEIFAMSVNSDLGYGAVFAVLICVLLFTLFHFPCGTTLLTIAHETGRAKWTALSALLPTVFGLLLCAAVNAVCRLFQLI